MKKATVILSAIAAVVFSAKACPAQGMSEDFIMPIKECSAILAGMANDARVDPSVSVTYTGTNLTLAGNGREYVAWCKNGRVFFSGSYGVSAQ